MIRELARKLTWSTGLTLLAAVILTGLLFAYQGLEAAAPTTPLEDSATYSVTGTVTFLDNGAPAANVVIVSSAAVTATTDDHGLFLVAGLPAGTHILTPTFENPNLIFEFEPISQTVVVPSTAGSQHFTVTGIIAVDYGLFGRVTDVQGAGLADVLVTLNDRFLTSSNEDGTFGFFPVSPGHHELSVAKPGYTFLPVKRTIQVPGNFSDQDFVGFSRDRIYIPMTMN